MLKQRSTRKDFAQIWDDYTFFEAHATEMEENLTAYLQHFREWMQRYGQVIRRRPLRILDFGCRSGLFLERFLKNCGLRKDEVLLSLVEPNHRTRWEAVQRLRPLTEWAIQAWNLLAQGSLISPFDLIISHHVLYYVPDLSGTIRELLNSLDQYGLLIASLGGLDNQMVRAWHELSLLLGQSVPYYNAWDVCRVLGQMDCLVEYYQVSSRLDFPDSAENRWRILHYLFSNFQLPTKPALQFFDRYTNNGRVVLHNTDELFVISHHRKGEANRQNDCRV